jgi:integrase
MANDRPGPNPRKPIVVYTAEEIETLLRHAAVVHDKRWYLFLATLVDSGRRVGEVLGLEFAWLNATSETPHFHLPTTKNGNQAYVPLSNRLQSLWTEDMVAWLRENHRGQFKRDVQLYPFPWTYQVAHRNFRHYCKKVGVESRAFHCFRHTKATEMIARGVPIQAVSALLGHANVGTTDAIYNHTTALTFSDYLER